MIPGPSASPNTRGRIRPPREVMGHQQGRTDADLGVAGSRSRVRVRLAGLATSARCRARWALSSSASSPAPSMRRRLAPAQERHAHHVEPRRGGDAAVVADAALVVEHRHVEPGEVGPVAGRPDDRLDLASREVERAAGVVARRGSARRGAVPRPRRRGRAPVAHSSMVSSSRPSLRSASVHWLRSEPENSAVPSRTPASRPTSRTPMRLQRVQVDASPGWASRRAGTTAGSATRMTSSTSS